MATYQLYDGTLFIGQTPDYEYMRGWVIGGSQLRWSKDQDGCEYHPAPDSQDAPLSESDLVL